MMLRHVVLNNGVKMPVLGMGTAFMTSKDHQAVFDQALHIGYRLFDTAYSYWNSALLGEVLLDNMRNGKVKRHDLFVTTKVPSVYLSPPDVKDCLDASLENLKLKYVDLLLIHYPWGQKNISGVVDNNIEPKDENGNRILCEYNLNETWKSFENLLEEKKVRAIGLSNFTPSLIDRIISKARIIPANLQMECNAYCQQHELVKYCSEKGISITAYAPFAKTGHATVSYKTPISLLEDNIIMKTANKHRKTPAQVLLRYLLQQNICTVPRTTNSERLHENLEVFNFELDSTDMAAINGLNQNLKQFTFPWAKKHPDYPKNGEPF